MLTGEASLRIEPTTGALTIEAESRDQSYSPFHMLGSALGMCTFSVLQSWSSNKNISASDLSIDISWLFAEGQHRVETMNVKLAWPSLSTELWPRALRAARLCGIHQSLTKAARITVDGVGAVSAAIEATADGESRRRTVQPSALRAQADGEPQPTSQP